MKKLSQMEQKFKDYLDQNNIIPFSAITEIELEKETKLFQEWAGEVVVPFEELSIKVRDGFKIRVRVFNPNALGDTFFYLPGNGYCIARLFEPNTAIAARIAKASQQRVVLIDFRLMPAYPWPTLIRDVQDVINACVHDHVISGVNPSEIILGGYSGGAHASVILALDQQRGFEIKKLVLLSGWYDLTLSQTAFVADEALDYICKRENLHNLVDAWKLTNANLHCPSYSPLFSSSFKQFPKTTIIVGEFDGIRGDSEALYLKLRDQGVSVTKIVLPGQTHNNIEFYKACSDENDAALACANVLCEESI